jgi:hypothetical protein
MQPPATNCDRDKVSRITGFAVRRGVGAVVRRVDDRGASIGGGSDVQLATASIVVRRKIRRHTTGRTPGRAVAFHGTATGFHRVVGGGPCRILAR